MHQRQNVGITSSDMFYLYAQKYWLLKTIFTPVLGLLVIFLQVFSYKRFFFLVLLEIP